LKGKQIAIKEVQSFDDSDFIRALVAEGYPKQEAEFLFFSLPPDDLKGKTPKEVVGILEKFTQQEPNIIEGEFSSETKLKAISARDTSQLLDQLIEVRPDLKKFNRITLINKLKSDIRDSTLTLKDLGVSGDADLVGKLREFFSHDKPLKEALEGERVLSSRPRMSRLK